jgi:hypothetical protein
MTGPRHTQIRPDAATGSLQNSENWRDLLDALKQRPAQRYVTVEPYTAVGSSSAKVRLSAARRPLCAELVRAAPYYAQGDPLEAVGNANFAWDSTSSSVDVYEPAGLTADTVYTLTFRITEG